MKVVDRLQRSVILLTGVFLYSLLTWLSEYWQSDTKLIVIWVLIITCIVEMFVPFKKGIRWMFTLLLSFLLLLIVLDWRIILPQENSSEAIIANLWQNVYQLEVAFPFIGFVLGTWLIYLVMIRWFESKSRALATILIGAITLTVIDTFTSLNLWIDILFMISAVLLLLVVHHFKVLRKKSPEGWNHLKDYPETVIVPIIIFFLVVFIVSITTPNVQPLLTDPYTAWKKYKGEEAMISRYTDPGDRDLADRRKTISGYSRDDSLLGGGFVYDYSLIMTVETSNPSYYRGETRDFYNGTGWEVGNVNEHFAGFRVLPSEGEQKLSNDVDNSYIDRTLLETKEISQTINFSENTAYKGHVLFGAYGMESIEIVELEDRESGIDFDYELDYHEDAYVQTPILWLENVEELHYLDETGMFPKEYTVTSEVPLIDEDGLRDAPSIDGEKDVWERFLQLPNDLPERVSELSEEIVVNQTNPYDQVKAIEAYLKETFDYTNEPDETRGDSNDFVDQFLFEVQEGYCDYFSTAMVVLTRSLDIPARWVKGFTQGSRNDEMDQYYYQGVDDPFGPGEYHVRNSNAHSWVEVYFEGYGWIPFEPTPTFSAPTLEVQDDTDPLIEIDEVEGDVSGIDNERSLALGTILQYILIVVGVAALTVILVLLLKRKNRFWRYFWKGRSAKSVNHKIVFEVEQFLHYGGKQGYKRLEHETLQETMTQWVGQSRLLESDLREVVILFEKAKYGDSQLSENELLLIQEKVRNLRQQMKK
ncbi:transglutaminase-like domain-containing protein [Salipaludibacillus sp. HK11]|uniref:transglutaminase-like domain-containing protein n=1 Tax=Salipaludibacillus sp. HK11 TaxID=3394320 RepID=UPI0039FD8AB5